MSRVVRVPSRAVAPNILRVSPRPQDHHSWMVRYLRRLDRQAAAGVAVSIHEDTLREVNRWFWNMDRGNVLAPQKYGNLLVGNNLATATIPQINETGVAAADKATPVNMDDTHFNQATGLQKPGNPNGYLNANFAPSDIGATAGLGCSILGAHTAGASASYIDTRSGTPVYHVLSDGSSGANFVFGHGANLLSVASATRIGFLRGKKASSTNRKLFLNGSQIGTSATSDATTALTTNFFFLATNNAGTPGLFSAARVGGFIVDNGGITDAQEPVLNTILSNFHSRLGR